MKAAVALLFAVGCAAAPTSITDEPLSCDVGASGSFENACVKASAPTPVSNGATVTANELAFGVRLASASSGYQATVHLTPAQSGTYELYVSSPTIPLEVVDTETGYDVGWSCMSSITSTECAYLRRVTTVQLTEGRHYDLRLGPYSASYVRLYVQLREEPTTTVCTSDELPEETAACTAADDGQTSITASTLTSTSPQTYAVDKVYLATLPSTGGSNYGGVIAFRPPSDGNYELYLGTPNIPVRIVGDDSSVTAASCSAYIPSTECNRLRRGSLLTLHGGDTYRLELGPAANTHYVRVELHTSAPTNPIRLGPPRTVASGGAPYCLTAGDLDGDGVLDLAVSSATQQAPGIELLRGDGSGAFSLVNQVATEAPGETVIADFNRDGIADVAGIANDGMGPLPDFYLQGTGGFAYTTSTWGHGRDFVASLSSGDFDEDGTPEIVASYPDTEQGTGQGGFVIEKMPGDLVVQDEAAFGVGTLQAIAGDFNGDGHQDVIVASRATSAVQLYYGNGTGTVAFASQIALPGSQIQTIAAFDLDRDGRSDLVTTFWDGTATVSYGTATGLTAPVHVPDSGRAIAAGDFDHDGRLDLAFAGGTQSAQIMIDLATPGGFVHGGALDAPNGTGLNLAVGDFNGDGFDDLATPSAGSVTVYLSTP